LKLLDQQAKVEETIRTPKKRAKLKENKLKVIVSYNEDHRATIGIIYL
jgi:hypothetical protein